MKVLHGLIPQIREKIVNMPYQVCLYPKAERDLSKLSRDMLRRISATIDSLAVNQRPHGCKKLKNQTGFRVRVGDYRILYEIDDKLHCVYVFGIPHRSESY